LSPPPAGAGSPSAAPRQNKSGNHSDTRDNKADKYLEHQSTQKHAAIALSDGLKPLFLNHSQ